MLLHRRPGPNEKFIVTITCTGIALCRQADGFPILVKKARVVLDSPPLPIPPTGFNSSDNAAVSALMARSLSSSNDIVHDKVFIPAIATMGALVIICVFCCYKLIVSKKTVVPLGITSSRGGYNEPPILQSQHAVQENGHGNRPLSRGFSKITRKSAPSTIASIPGSPSVRSDTIGYHHYLQQQRQQQQRQQLEQQQQQQQQDPYRQYIMAHDHGYPQQHHQPTPHPSVAGSIVHRGQGVQPQPPHGVTQAVGPALAGDGRDPDVVQHPPFPNAAIQRPATHQIPLNANPAVRAGWEPYWGQQEHQNSQQQQQQNQQQQPVPRIPHISSAQTSSTRVTSDILSYMTPPEARRPQLPSNQSQPQNQDYFTVHQAGSTTIIPSQAGGSTTHGIIAHSGIPANHTLASRAPSSPNSAHVAHGYTNTHVNSNQPPRYAETRNDVQEK